MKFGALLEEKRQEGPEEFCAYYLRYAAPTQRGSRAQ